MLLLNEKHIYTPIEQTNTKPPRTLELKKNRQIETFSISPAINFSEEGKWLLAVTSFEATNSIFKKTHGSNKFLIVTPGPWRSFIYSPDAIFDNLKEISELRSQSDIEIHVEEVERKGYSKRKRKQWL